MSLNTLEILLKIFLACVLGGIIGLERESVNRPAGFRTHILVSVGATVVMITNIELVSQMIQIVDVQPGRFGAAVISGIGFLGAGTIIKNKNTVKGLTTAASLWSTACIGLALGSGLYTIALAATFFVFLTLEFFPKIEGKLSSSKYSKIKITTINSVGQLSRISQSFEKLHVNVLGIKTEHDVDDDDEIIILFKVKCPDKNKKTKIIEHLTNLKGITEVELDPEQE